MPCNFERTAAAYTEVFEAAYVAARQVTRGLLDEVLVELEKSDSIVSLAARDELDVRDRVMTVGCLK